MVQVTKEEGYGFEKYGGVSRFASYAYQIREILRTSPTSVLEIGVGDAVVGTYIKRQTNISYVWADIAQDLQPDVVADVRKLPFPDDAFDTACAFEVLEHLPFEDFEKALSELVRVAKRYVLISLPHFGPPIQFLLKIPFLSQIRISYKLPFAKAHIFNGQHYWEIGKRGYPAVRIREEMRKHGVVEREFVPFENQYHHFFRIRLRAKGGS